MYGQVDPPFRERAVELLDEQPLAADLIERFVQDHVAQRLHGDEFAVPERAADLLGLHNREPAVPASHFDHVNSSNTARMRFAAAAVLPCAAPRDTTPAVNPPPSHTAGKKKVDSAAQSATLHGMPIASQSCAMRG